MKILFVGNSHTYCNALPFQVRELINAAPGVTPPCEAYMCTTGGRSLDWHSREVGTLHSIACVDWDVVVLQERTHPFEGRQALRDACDRLKPYLDKSGARVVLYATWAHRDRPEEQEMMETAFASVAREMGSGLAPVSTAWHRVLREAPDIELYRDDGSHAAPAGTYLAACVLFGVLTGHSPVGAQGRIEVKGTVLADLADAVARRLQDAAWQAVQSAADVR